MLRLLRVALARRELFLQRCHLLQQRRLARCHCRRRRQMLVRASGVVLRCGQFPLRVGQAPLKLVALLAGSGELLRRAFVLRLPVVARSHSSGQLRLGVGQLRAELVELGALRLGARTGRRL